MCPGDDEKKPGDGILKSDAQFDNTDEKEDTQPDIMAARQRRRIAIGALSGVVAETRLDLVQAAQVELGLQLGALTQRMDTMVERMVDLMVSDQDHDEVMTEVRKELAETRAEVKRLLDWIEANRGP